MKSHKHDSTSSISDCEVVPQIVDTQSTNCETCGNEFATSQDLSRHVEVGYSK